jgi:hypothetical protein
LTNNSERLLQRWKQRAYIGLAVSIVLFIALVFAVGNLFFTKPLTDERLIGTWQSDADRTIDALRQRKPLDEKQEAGLRQLFGQLRITYSKQKYTTELNGVSETVPYEVLGRDKQSVVLRDKENTPSILDVTEFAIIHFDGPDSYWLVTKVGGIQEYFKRVR